MNNNNTTASDNSSDSASNKKSTRTEIEIIDQKIIKCINEINNLEHKIQRIFFFKFFILINVIQSA